MRCVQAYVIIGELGTAAACKGMEGVSVDSVRWIRPTDLGIHWRR